MRVNEFTSTLTNPKYQLDKNGWIIFSISSVALFFLALGVNSSFKDTVGSKASPVSTEVVQNTQQSITTQGELPTSDVVAPVATNVEPEVVPNSLVQESANGLDCKNIAYQAASNQQLRQGFPTTVLRSHFNIMLNKCYYEVKAELPPPAGFESSAEVDIRSAPDDDWIVQCSTGVYQPPLLFCTQHNVGSITELQFKQFENKYFSN